MTAGTFAISHICYFSKTTLLGDLAEKVLSEFVSRLPQALFSRAPPTLTVRDRLEIANLLGREMVNEEVVQHKIQQQYVI